MLHREWQGGTSLSGRIDDEPCWRSTYRESMYTPVRVRQSLTTLTYQFWCLPGADEDLDVQVTVSGPVNGPG